MKEGLTELPKLEDLIDKRLAKKFASQIVERGIQTFQLTETEVLVLKAAYGVEKSPDYELFQKYFPLEETLIVFKFRSGKQDYFGQFGFDKDNRLVSTRTITPFKEATAVLEGNKGGVSYQSNPITGRDPSLMGFRSNDKRIKKYVYPGC